MISFIGVDPGLSGALALLRSDGAALVVVDMPTLELKKAKGAKRYIDYAALTQIVQCWSLVLGDNGAKPVCVVELVGSMPGQGIASAFDFGRSFGAALTACHGASLRVEQVTPAVWKRAVGIPTGAGKDQSRARAMNLFPNHAGLFARAKDDGRADAALLAWYGARTLNT
jgi:Holliday junction resolvasome RuvABC endonuclease subunit